ncbi:heterokaryon incompatibility protein-domain-containing protein [Immersiella caudata]|uniref:Heterokaryon incompatibility protein-domain-containing protein n=1 Tax=Immersiella caudata TaxID=314043 RepID=A0AA39WAS0_9PEZI|nr:heterokaryon incompatibility protein-domain-containing protein [Immersiella caudata]
MEGSDDMTYPGSKLNTSKQQIRLLTVSPGQGEDTIVCCLRTVDVEGTGEYEALSYAWGTASSGHSISVNSHNFEVGDNLFYALSHLRLQDTDRVLWIDAICINQSDVSERNHQVQQMAEVYSRAKQVVAWLGLGNASSESAIGFLREAYTLGHLSRERLQDDERWVDLEDLCDRDYWRRLWIVQEICLATRVVIVCGDEQVPWPYLSDLRKARTHVWTKYLSDGERAFMRSYPARIDQQRTNRQKNGAVLWVLLENFQDSACKDFHDRVYGLLALSTDCGNRGIPVDYSSTPYQLYRDIMLFYHDWYQRQSHPSAGAQLMQLNEFLQQFLRLYHYHDLTRSAAQALCAARPIRIPACNILVIEKLIDASAIGPFVIGGSVKDHEGVSQSLARNLKRQWILGPGRSKIFSSEAIGGVAGFAVCHVDIPAFDFGAAEPVEEPCLFVAKPIVGSIAPGSSAFVGVAPRGSMPGDLVCSFVESSVTLILRQAPVMVSLGSSRDLAGGRGLLTVRPKKGRGADEFQPSTLDQMDTRREANISASQRFRQRWADRQTTRTALQLTEQWKTGQCSDRAGEPQHICAIIGRGFLDFTPLSQYDGFVARLTREKAVETIQTSARCEANLWPFTLTIKLATLQALSVP